MNVAKRPLSWRHVMHAGASQTTSQLPRFAPLPKMLPSRTMTRAAILMFFAMSLIPAGDSAGKWLSTSGVSPIFVAWSRFVLGALLVLPFYGAAAWPLMRLPQIWLRGALLAGGITSIQFALRAAPIGDVFAAFFIAPLISYVLAGWLLREPMSRLRSAMILAGFGGVLLVVRPGADMQIGLLWAVAAGTFYGCFLTSSRLVKDIGNPGPVLVTQLVIAGILTAPLAMAHIPIMTGQIWGLTAISATCSMLGNLILLYAYRLAPATMLAPLVYFQLFAAVLFGWLIFSQTPDMPTWVGIAIILTTGVIAARAK